VAGWLSVCTNTCKVGSSWYWEPWAAAYVVVLHTFSLQGGSWQVKLSYQYTLRRLSESSSSCCVVHFRTRHHHCHRHQREQQQQQQRQQYELGRGNEASYGRLRECCEVRGASFCWGFRRGGGGEVADSKVVVIFSGC
jgi:hypothetical protein